MARRSQHSQEEIRNGRFNFNMVKLLPDRKKALYQLECYINDKIDDYQESNDQRVTDFYIGKSSVPRSKTLKFDIDNPQKTWEHARIQSRWSDHKRNGYTTMVVIGVISDNTLPNGLENAQKYCLSLESELINRFKFDIQDNRIANESSDAGREAKDYDTIAYVLYIVMKLEHPPHMHYSNSSLASRRRNCGQCHGCCTSDCGVCKHCQDKPKFGGPGVKKQRCIRRKCTSHLERPLRSSQQQFSVQRHGQLSPISTKTHKIEQTTSREGHRHGHGRGREMVIDNHTVTTDDRCYLTHERTSIELHKHKHYEDSRSSPYKLNHSKRSMQLQGSTQKVDREKRMDAPTSSNNASRKRSSTNIDIPLSEPPYKRRKVDSYLKGTSRMVTSSPNRAIESVHNYDRERRIDRSRPSQTKLSYKAKGHTWKTQPYTHTRMQITDKQRRIKDHTGAHLSHASRKRSSRIVGMTFSEPPYKRHRMDPNSTSKMIKLIPSSLRLVRNDCYDHKGTFRPMSRLRPNQSRFANQHEDHSTRRTLPHTYHTRETRKSSGTKVKSNRHSANYVSSNKDLPPQTKISLEPKGSGRSIEYLKNIKLLKKVGSMQTEELVQWFDIQSPEKRCEVKQLLKRRDSNKYNKLMARSKTANYHR